MGCAFLSRICTRTTSEANRQVATGAPNNRLQPDRDPLAVPTEAKRTRLGGSRCAEALARLSTSQGATPHLGSETTEEQYFRRES